MQWCTDFCLFCDREVAGGAYCSQNCRMSDLDRVQGTASSLDSSALLSSRPSSTTPASSSTPTSAFQLLPAIDFSAYRSTNYPFHFDAVHSSRPTRQSAHTPQRSPITVTPTSSTGAMQLKSSSSGTSLVSLQSTPSTRTALSQQSRNDLSAYANSFDQTRDLRRRKSLF